MTLVLKTVHIHYHKISVVQESGHCLTGFSVYGLTGCNQGIDQLCSHLEAQLEKISLLSQFLLLGIVLDICWLPGSVIHHLVFSLFIFILNRKCFLQSLTLSIVMIYSIHCFKKYFGNHIFNFQGFFLVLWLLL